MKSLIIFDLDYTLFKTEAKVALYENGEYVKHFSSSHEYYQHLKIKKDHHTYDFKEYTSAISFKEQAEPIHHIIDRMREAILDDNSDVVLLTARNQIDDMGIFRGVFEDYDLDTRRIEFEFSGDIRDRFGRKNITVAEAKVWVIKNKYLPLEIYNVVEMYDDLNDNLALFSRLRYDYKDIEFKPFLVKETK